MRIIVRRFILILLICLLLPSYAKVDEALDLNKRLSYVNLPFFERFGDEWLCFYILEAIKNNHEAKSALYKSEQFRYQARISLAAQFPSFNVQTNYLGIKIPMLDDNFPIKQNGFILPFEANYEADLLLKNADKTKSKKRLYRASLYDEKAIYIMLASDVATSYINLLGLDKTILIYQKIIKDKEEILARTGDKYKFGIISKTELNEIKKDLNDKKQELEETKKQRDTTLNNLALLVGKSAFCTNDLQRSGFENFAPDIKVADAIPSHVIFERPDVEAALQRLLSAKIDITVAKKEFFPSFNITGFYAFNTIGPGNFFSWRSTFAAIIAGATTDIFKGGEKIANLKLKRARYKELLENYFHTDLKAIKEISDALYKINYDEKILKEAQEKYLAQKENYRLEKLRNKEGVSDDVALLRESAELSDNEKNYTTKRVQKFIDIISLYKSTGGAL